MFGQMGLSLFLVVVMMMMIVWIGFWRWTQKGRSLWWSLMTNGCLTLMFLLEFLRKSTLNLLLLLLLNLPLCMFLNLSFSLSVWVWILYFRYQMVLLIRIGCWKSKAWAIHLFLYVVDVVTILIYFGLYSPLFFDL